MPSVLSRKRLLKDMINKFKELGLYKEVYKTSEDAEVAKELPEKYEDISAH